MAGRFFATLLFALVVTFFPWEWVRGDAFADLVNYSTRIYQLRDYGAGYFVWEDSLLGWLRYEYLWFRMLVLAAQLDLDPQVFIKTITFVSSLLTFRFLARRIGVPLSFLVLLNPITIDLLSSQIRSAFAFALFLAVVDLRPGTLAGRWRLLLLAPLPFIHTALLLIIAVYIGALILTRHIDVKPLLKTGITVLGSIALVALIAIALPSIVEATEDRRNLLQYGTKTITYLAYWIVLFAAFSWLGKNGNGANWRYHFVLVIGIVGTAIEAINLPGFRFVALIIPVTFSLMPMITGTPLRMLIMATLAYDALLYYYWVQ